MKRIPCVTGARYRGGYRIRVAFDDGTEKTVDFRRWLRGPAFKPLADVAFFRRFFLDGWTVAWPNGADIAPEALYECKAVAEERTASRGTLPHRARRVLRRAIRRSGADRVP